MMGSSHPDKTLPTSLKHEQKGLPHKGKGFILEEAIRVEAQRSGNSATGELDVSTAVLGAREMPK